MHYGTKEKVTEKTKKGEGGDKPRNIAYSTWNRPNSKSASVIINTAFVYVKTRTECTRSQ
jgi:hypothetical protein